MSFILPRQMFASGAPAVSVSRHPAKPRYVESGTFNEVVPMKRLAYQETVTLSGEQIHTHATVIDFRDLGGKTEVTVSTSGWEAWRNADGWVPALEKLAAHLGGEPRLRA
jgi:uncharacterized protein YndB with AHSA1/START domain